jgi:hypothetical protein
MTISSTARARVGRLQTQGITPPVTGSGPRADAGTETMLVASAGAVATGAAIVVDAVVVDIDVVGAVVVVDTDVVAGAVVVVTQAGIAVIERVRCAGCTTPLPVRPVSVPCDAAAPAVVANVRPRRTVTSARLSNPMAAASSLRSPMRRTSARPDLRLQDPARIAACLQRATQQLGLRGSKVLPELPYGPFRPAIDVDARWSSHLQAAMATGRRSLGPAPGLAWPRTCKCRLTGRTGGHRSDGQLSRRTGRPSHDSIRCAA